MSFQCLYSHSFKELLLILIAGAGFFVLPLYETTSEEHVNDVDNAEDDEGTEVRVEGSATYRTLLSSPLMLVSAVVTFLTAVSTQWYQPSLEPYVREQLGLSPFQVRTCKQCLFYNNAL